MITQHSELAQFVRDLRAGGPAGFGPAVTDFLHELSDVNPTDDEMVRLSAIFGLAMNWSDLVQDSIEAGIERLAEIDSGTQSRELCLLRAGLWLLCKRKTGIDPPDRFGRILSTLTQVNEETVCAAAADLLAHGDVLENCQRIRAGYHLFNDRVWYREIVEECIAYLADRRGLRIDQQLGVVFLFTCWDVSESKLSPWLVRKLYESSNIPAPLLLGLIFRLSPEFHAASVRRGKQGHLRNLICKGYSQSVQIGLDAMLT